MAALYAALLATIHVRFVVAALTASRLSNTPAEPSIARPLEPARPSAYEEIWRRSRKIKLPVLPMSVCAVWWHADRVADEREDTDELLRSHPLRSMRPSGRWPSEPPGPDVDPGAGDREPRRRLPMEDTSGAAHQPE